MSSITCLSPSLPPLQSDEVTSLSLDQMAVMSPTHGGPGLLPPQSPPSLPDSSYFLFPPAQAHLRLACFPRPFCQPWFVPGNL